MKLNNPSPGGGGGSGDMTKAVYDPQNAGKISGGTTGVGTGGVLSMVAAATNAGSITTDGGSGTAGGDINTTGAGQGGGSILTYANGTGAGGSIKTFGGDAGAGGSIDTHDGGGSINTRGTGSIELGAAGTRTTLTGAASADRSIAFPDAAGTVLLANGSGAALTDITAGQVGAAPSTQGVAADTGWGTQTFVGDKTVLVPDYDASTFSAAAALVGLDALNAQVGVLTDVVAALRIALALALRPNA